MIRFLLDLRNTLPIHCRVHMAENLQRVLHEPFYRRSVLRIGLQEPVFTLEKRNFMKVRCIKLIDSHGAPQAASSWLTIGKLYNVLAMEVGRSGLLLRLRGDGKYRVALFPMESFDIVSPELPPSWIVSYNHELFKIGQKGGCNQNFGSSFMNWSRLL